MPTSTQHAISLYRQPILFFKAGNTVTPDKSTVPINTIYLDQDKEKSTLSAKRKTPKRTNVFDNDFEQFPRNKKSTKLLLAAVIALLTLLIMAIVALAIVLPLLLKNNNSITTTATSIITTTRATTTPTTRTTTTTTTTTATPGCVSPYVRAPSGNCTNILLDFHNCGAIGNNCSNNYTGCSAGICSNVPTVQLINATSIWTGGINGSADDDIFNVTLPFNITVYNTTTNHIQVTTNGVLCLNNCSDAWLETSLPNNSFGAAVLPYWDDLYIYAKTWQGIYFASQGNAPNRTLVVEYYTSQFGSANQFYQFQVVFFEASPGIVQFIYFNADDTGATSTVGVQGSNRGPFLQYSFDQANSVQPNMTLTFNTNLGSYTNSTIG